MAERWDHATEGADLIAMRANGHDWKTIGAAIGRTACACMRYAHRMGVPVESPDRVQVREEAHEVISTAQPGEWFEVAYVGEDLTPEQTKDIVYHAARKQGKRVRVRCTRTGVQFTVRGDE